eukprot:TRINITY_DN4997_c0_g1::TRINITY_DN4997_c0_g1_i1::g.16584::m.16584 TRINITY_DN4997_c0_g1::TRINITY_DN4997_c0_g1_i1::g.16584  ORF type:complete len:299 (+),score=62.23,sp/Q9Y314/NOSIP_HUMAN/40.47/4e-69,Rtf2/PF04641.7/0.00024,Rtf2/PF04641.7/6.7e+02,Rtf2/PF04641.7/1.2e-06,zf-Nse/PF11789.3/0.015,zf-Nse/PF11789.3/56,zf-Nse/PF11789.3/9.1e+02,U-box/PF04564.10/0.12,U-box/PF04564.10/1.9e+03,U-box/PF04564.10/36,zf-RING_2/PF13639.1/5.8e+03,zf-RING_2/PF13639.1/0.0012,zf-C3HC4_2/PF13923.1/7.9e+03,zf-C3HC4_2/PF139
MSRHAKNNTAAPVFTYHERREMERAYGVNKARIGNDSVKEFDCCSLSLKPCRTPMVSPYGDVYEKEAIFEYLLHQRKQIAKQTELWEKQMAEKAKEVTDAEDRKKKEVLDRFDRQELGVMPERSPTEPPRLLAEATKAVSTIDGETLRLRAEERRVINDSEFWLPGKTPGAKASAVEKPDITPKCPMTGKPLRVKQLVEITFTPLKARDKANEGGKARYMCPICYTTLTNAVQCAALKSSGNVVCKTCLDNVVKKDWIDPIASKKVSEKDIIMLKRGTGFAGSGTQLIVEKHAVGMRV